MEPRISLITLGVRDLERAICFYDGMGLPRKNRSAEGVAFFDLNGVVLSLYPQEDLNRDIGGENSTMAHQQAGLTTITLAHNTREKAEVAAVLKHAETLGATIIKAAQDTFWGGHAGYFKDLDGHLWEIAWNPFFTMREDGRIVLTD